MRIFKSHPLLKLVNSYIIDSPQPSNISYLWNFGSLLAACLAIQIITGVTLAMHYSPNVLEAFHSVEHIMRDVNNGWLIRYLHSNTASAFFFIVYLHISRGLYYGSYKAPRTLVWTIGTVIFILMMATAFLGYVLPYGQMSLWGATVITNLMSAIPWVGQDIVEFIWGGFSVNNATLNRFFALHFVLPFILAALALMHLIALHDSAGSGNPIGTSGNYDRLAFAPYYLFKDLITIFILVLVISLLVFFMPNLLGDSENYVMANPMQTPPAIVPEWYLLPFYAILRSIPNKLLGVIAMFSAILILLALPFTDLSRSRGIQFRPLSKIAFFIFIGNFLILLQLGAKHVESPFIELGQISTVIYFAYFLIIMPLVSLFENSLQEFACNNKSLKVKTHNAMFLPLTFIIAVAGAIHTMAVALYLLIVELRNTSFSKKNFFNLSGSLKKIYSNYIIPILKSFRNILLFIKDFIKLSKFKNTLVKFKNINNKGILSLITIFPYSLIVINSTGQVNKSGNIDITLPGFKIFSFTYALIINGTILILWLVGLSKIDVVRDISSSLYNLILELIKRKPAMCDAPRPWGINFQDSATPQMEGLVELHDNILFYLAIILFSVGWILWSIVRTFANNKSPISYKYVSHGTLIELIWTISPAIFLILIAFPSFKLLYLMDEVTDPALALLAEGHQWYWSYQYPDFLNSENEFIEFDSYLVPESDLENGALRMLEVDNRVVLPETTHVRFVLTGGDVIHSYACPALGIKCDAYPGRLNQASVLLNREGTFYGQCSEICGILHSSMPIVIESVSIEKFVSWVQEQ